MCPMVHGHVSAGPMESFMMRNEKREVRIGFAITGMILGLLVSLVDPVGRHFDVSEATTRLLKGMLLACSVLMVMLAIRQIRQSARS